jgi:putative flavoprotein involved in K+ transport
VPPRRRSSAGQISMAKKMTPRMLIGMDMRSPISLALASSAFSIAARMPALRARRYTWAPSWPDSRMMSASSAKDPVVDYLQTYVTAFDLPVQLNARVTSLTRTDDGFEIRTTDDTFHARQVVVATGPFRVPFVPPAAQGLEPSVPQVHCASYRNPEALPGGSVLVVGGGNSGFQIAEELAATRQVDLSIGERAPRLPQRLAGRDLFWWLTRLALLRVTVDSRPGRRASRREFIIGTNKRRLRKVGVRFRPRLVEADGRTVRFADGSTYTASGGGLGDRLPFRLHLDPHRRWS